MFCIGRLKTGHVTRTVKQIIFLSYIVGGGRGLRVVWRDAEGDSCIKRDRESRYLLFKTVCIR